MGNSLISTPMSLLTASFSSVSSSWEATGMPFLMGELGQLPEFFRGHDLFGPVVDQNLIHGHGRDLPAPVGGRWIAVNFQIAVLSLTGGVVHEGNFMDQLAADHISGDLESVRIVDLQAQVQPWWMRWLRLWIPTPAGRTFPRWP
jgi:hypothetical protein